MKRGSMILPVLSAAVLLAIPGTSSNARPATAPSGKQLFAERCAACHGENGYATRILARRVPEGEAMLEKRSVLPADYVRTVVRSGLGDMPPIRAAELDDGDLAAIANYLETKR